MDDRPVLALPKGRILRDLLPLLEKAGYHVPKPADHPRSLRFDMPDLPFRILLLRAADLPVYVMSGAADAGVAGLDQLLESNLPIYMPLDLGIGICHMSVIGPPGRVLEPGERPVRVATKFPKIAAGHFASAGFKVETMKLHGNVELASSCGLAEWVVDLVETGETLRRNGLVEYERFLQVSSRLVCNRASWHLRFDSLHELVSNLRDATAPPRPTVSRNPSENP